MTIFQFLETWDASDKAFVLLFTFAILTMLYAVNLIHVKMRLLENELQNVKKDQSVMSEELELMAKMKNGNEL